VRKPTPATSTAEEQAVGHCMLAKDPPSLAGHIVLHRGKNKSWCYKSTWGYEVSVCYVIPLSIDTPW